MEEKSEEGSDKEEVILIGENLPAETSHHSIELSSDEDSTGGEEEDTGNLYLTLSLNTYYNNY